MTRADSPLFRGLPRRALGWAVVVWVGLLGASSGCSDAPAKRCPGAKTAVTKDGRIRVTQVANVDRSGGGWLKGEARSGKRPLRALLLLDYSGSMYPGYASEPPAGCPSCKASVKKRGGQPYYYAVPAFQDLVARWVDEASPRGAEVDLDVLLFNKNLYTLSPTGKLQDAAAFPPRFDLKLAVAGPEAIAERLARIPPDPIAADRKGAQRTRLKEAVEGAASFLSDEGLIWVVTDNIADTSGVGVSQADAARNLAFYNLLKDDPRLQSIYAYPLHAGDSCSFFCGTSLFVYGIHFSSRQRSSVGEADRLAGGHLKGGSSKARDDGVLWNSGLAKVASEHGGEPGQKTKGLAGVPLRLKPLDVHVVSVSFEKGKSGRPRPLKCKRTVEFGQPIPCVANLVIQNNLRHQRVESATVVFENDLLLPHKKNERTALGWASQVCPGEVVARAARTQKGEAKPTGGEAGSFPIKALGPGQVEKRKVVLLVPPVEVAPTGVGELFDTALTDQLLLEGTLLARVKNVRTSLEVPASEREAVYGAANLPQIFTSRSESEIRVRFPLLVPVHNDGKLRGLLFLGGLALLLLLVGFVVLKIQRVPIAVVIDGVETDRLSLSRFSSRSIERGGTRLGRARRGFGRQVRFVGAKGVTTRRTGQGWSVTPPGGVELLLQLRAGWGRRRRSDGVGSSGGGF